MGTGDVLERSRGPGGGAISRHNANSNGERTFCETTTPNDDKAKKFLKKTDKRMTKNGKE